MVGLTDLGEGRQQDPEGDLEGDLHVGVVQGEDVQPRLLGGGAAGARRGAGAHHRAVGRRAPRGRTLLRRPRRRQHRQHRHQPQQQPRPAEARGVAAPDAPSHGAPRRPAPGSSPLPYGPAAATIPPPAPAAATAPPAPPPAGHWASPGTRLRSPPRRPLHAAGPCAARGERQAGSRGVKGRRGVGTCG